MPIGFAISADLAPADTAIPSVIPTMLTYMGIKINNPNREGSPAGFSSRIKNRWYYINDF